MPGYDWRRAIVRPACGGDYYDAMWGRRRRGRLLLCVADVSGKGLPAALVMSNMQATLRALLGRIARCRRWRASQRLLFAATAPEKYVTAALLISTPATGDLRFVGAGHVDT